MKVASSPEIGNRNQNLDFALEEVSKIVGRHFEL